MFDGLDAGVDVGAVLQANNIEQLNRASHLPAAGRVKLNLFIGMSLGVVKNEC